MVIVKHFDIRWLIAENNFFLKKFIHENAKTGSSVLQVHDFITAAFSNSFKGYRKTMESACFKMLCCIMHANDVNANVLMLIRLVSTFNFRWEN